MKIGVVGLVWFVFWIMIVSNSPEKHSTISEEEKRYILHALKGSSSNTKVNDNSYKYVNVIV